ALSGGDTWYVDNNPAQLDVFDVFDPDSGLVQTLRRIRQALGNRAVLVISGNHEDDAWLAQLHQRDGDVVPVVPLAPVGLFDHVASGTVMTVSGRTMAFLGGIAAPGFPFDFDRGALERL